MLLAKYVFCLQEIFSTCYSAVGGGTDIKHLTLRNPLNISMRPVAISVVVVYALSSVHSVL